MTTPYRSIIVRKVVQVVNPVIRLYALYVLFHGHYSPGGGFQAGILLGASFILTILTEGSPSPKAEGSPPEANAQSQFSRNAALGAACVGLMIYTGLGMVALFKGGSFLDYSLLPFGGMESAARRSLGILGVETGICITVTGGILSIFYSLADIGAEGSPSLKAEGVRKTGERNKT